MLNKKRVRVLMVSGESPPIMGGISDFTIALLRSLKKLSPDMTFSMLSRRARWFYLPLIFDNKTHFPIYKPVWSWLGWQNRCAIFFARFIKYDILHIQEESYSFFETDFTIRLAKLKPDVPLVLTLHELHDDRQATEFTLQLISLADTVIANDSRTAERCIKHSGRRVDYIFCSPSSIEPVHSVEFRQPQNALFCTFGLINRLKRLDVVYEGLKIARLKFPQIQWQIIGPFDPDSIPDHARLAELTRNDEWVTFTGSLEPNNALPLALEKSACMLLPFDDGASVRRTSLQAAWKFGIPVISTLAEEHDTAIIPGKNILVAEKENPNSWSKLVEYFLTELEIQQKLHLASLEIAQQFSFDAQAIEYMNIYRKLLANGNHRKINPKRDDEFKNSITP